MSRRRIPNIAHATRWVLCAAIAIVALTSMLRDGPSETQAAQDVADYSDPHSLVFFDLEQASDRVRSVCESAKKKASRGSILNC